VASGSSSTSGFGSNQVRNEVDAITRAPVSTRTLPAPPKWSGWEWVTTTEWTCLTSDPARPRRSSSDFHDAGPGRPGSTMVKPCLSSRA
jgi:hypothetical protein